jgi:hypothetical protein
MPAIAVTLPLHIVSEANAREHWRVVAKRKASHREIARAMLQRYARPNQQPITVVLTRIGKKTLDGDNLQGGFTATRNGVADWLGIDDGSPLLTWRYAQEKGKQYSAHVAVTWGA